MSRVLTTTQPNAEGFELRSNNAGNFIATVETVTPDWIADAYVAALAVTNWYLDGVTGSDQNDGLTPATALQSGAELQRRLGPQARWTASVTIHVGAGGVDSLCLRGETASAGVSVDVIGTPTLVADAGTVSAYTAMNHSTPRSPTLQCTGVTDWTPYVGMRVRLTSGLNVGGCTWILKANPDGLGLNVARTSVWYKINNVVPSVDMTATAAPSVGNAVVIEDVPLAGTIDLDLIGTVALPGGNAWPNRQYSVQSIAINSLAQKSSCDFIDAERSVIFGCRLANVNAENRLYNGFARLFSASCLFSTSDNSRILLGGTHFGLGTRNVSTISAVSAGPLNVLFSVLQGTALNHIHGSGFVVESQIFDVVGATTTAYFPWNVAVTNLSGNNNAGYGIALINRANCSFSGTQNLTGSVANVRLNSNPAANLPLTVTMASLLPINDFARSGTAKLVAGTVTVTVPYTDWTSQRLTLGRSNPSAAVGELSAPTASRTTTFVINSSNVADTSDVQWSISPLGRNIFIASGT
jgi:hypothetical protein